VRYALDLSCDHFLKSKGIETEEDAKKKKVFLRKIEYKL